MITLYLHCNIISIIMYLAEHYVMIYNVIAIMI